MDTELQAIRDAMDKGEDGQARDHERAVALADEYVAAHPEKFEKLREQTSIECVQAVDTFRAAGWEEDLWLVETWLLHRFNPQVIGGVTGATVRMS